MFQETNYGNLSMNKHQAPQLNTGRDHVEECLNKQELHQLYKIPRKSKDVNNFTPIKPFRSLLTDLFDFPNKQRKQYRYILTVMGNFSRYLWSEPLRDKAEWKVGSGLDRLFTHYILKILEILILDISIQTEVLN